MAKDRKIDMVILGLLSHDDLTGYDIKKQIDGSIRFFWKGSFGSIYPALAELEKQGSVRRLKGNDSGGREKIIYSITGQGKEILRAWVRDEKASNDLKYETLMKLFFGGVESKETALRNIEVFEEQIKADLKVLQVYKANIEKALDEFRYSINGIQSGKLPLYMRMNAIRLSVLDGNALLSIKNNKDFSEEKKQKLYDTSIQFLL